MALSITKMPFLMAIPNGPRTPIMQRLVSIGKGSVPLFSSYGVNNVNRYLQLVSFSGQYHYDNVYKQGSYWTKR